MSHDYYYSYVVQNSNLHSNPIFMVKNCKPVQIHRKVSETCDDKIISKQVIEKWCNMFKNGCTDFTKVCLNKDTLPQVKKAKVVASARKVMMLLFFYYQSVVYSELMPKIAMTNLAAYCETSKKLREAIKDQRTGKLSQIVLFHGNATPQSVKVTKELLPNFKWKILEHPPYSPDVSLCNFHVFGPVKNF